MEQATEDTRLLLAANEELNGVILYDLRALAEIIRDVTKVAHDTELLARKAGEELYREMLEGQEALRLQQDAMQTRAKSAVLATMSPDERGEYIAGRAELDAINSLLGAETEARSIADDRSKQARQQETINQLQVESDRLETLGRNREALALREAISIARQNDAPRALRERRDLLAANVDARFNQPDDERDDDNRFASWKRLLDLQDLNAQNQMLLVDKEFENAAIEARIVERRMRNAVEWRLLSDTSAQVLAAEDAALKIAADTNRKAADTAAKRAARNSNAQGEFILSTDIDAAVESTRHSAQVRTGAYSHGDAAAIQDTRHKGSV
ncbi:MAG: hypothetical protein KC496_12065, partial [Anaerolineae bacterium]|nr:hypothetical protein [Anaerolineae bacterium]